MRSVVDSSCLRPHQITGLAPRRGIEGSAKLEKGNALKTVNRFMYLIESLSLRCHPVSAEYTECNKIVPNVIIFKCIKTF